MKKLTLDKTWSECLRMWEWISKEIGRDKNLDVVNLKWQWLEANGYDPSEIEEKCFFCEYDKHYENNCEKCPPVKIDKHFDCAYQGDGICWCCTPLKFYAKLVELNKIRLAKKRKTKKRKK